MSIPKVKSYQVSKGTIRKIRLTEDETLLLKKEMRSKLISYQG
ncbi:hypothetical protein [Brevibacillus sp. NRS-1366]